MNGNGAATGPTGHARPIGAATMRPTTTLTEAQVSRQYPTALRDSCNERN